MNFHNNTNGEDDLPQDLLSLLKKCLNDADDPQTAATILPELEKYTSCALSLSTLFRNYTTEDLLMDFVLHEESISTIQTIISIIGFLDLYLPPQSALATSAAATASTSTTHATLLFRALVHPLAKILLEMWLLLQERDIERFVFSATSVSNATNSNYETPGDLIRRREDFLEIIFEYYKTLSYRWIGRPVTADIASQYVRLTATTYATFTPPLVTLLHYMNQPTSYSPLQSYTNALLGTHTQASSSSYLQQCHQQSLEQFRSVQLATLVQNAVIDIITQDWQLFVSRATTLTHISYDVHHVGYVYPNASLLFSILQLLLNHRTSTLQTNISSNIVVQFQENDHHTSNTNYNSAGTNALIPPYNTVASDGNKDIEYRNQNITPVFLLQLISDFLKHFVFPQLLVSTPAISVNHPNIPSTLMERLSLLRDSIVLLQHSMCISLRKELMPIIAECLVNFLEHYEEELNDFFDSVNSTTNNSSSSSSSWFAIDYETILSWLFFCLRDLPIDYYNFGSMTNAQKQDVLKNSRSGGAGNNNSKSLWYRVWLCVYSLRHRFLLTSDTADTTTNNSNSSNSNAEEEYGDITDDKSSRLFTLFGNTSNTKTNAASNGSTSNNLYSSNLEDSKEVQKVYLINFQRLMSEFTLLVMRSSQESLTGRWSPVKGVTDTTLSIEDAQCHLTDSYFSSYSDEETGQSQEVYQGSPLKLMVQEMIHTPQGLSVRTASDVTSEVIFATMITTLHESLSTVIHCFSEDHNLDGYSVLVSVLGLDQPLPTSYGNTTSSGEVDLLSAHTHTSSNSAAEDYADSGYAPETRDWLLHCYHLMLHENFTPPLSNTFSSHLQTYAEISSQLHNRWQCFHVPLLPVVQLTALLQLSVANWKSLVRKVVFSKEKRAISDAEVTKVVESFQKIVLRLVLDVFFSLVEDALYLLDTVSLAMRWSSRQAVGTAATDLLLFLAQLFFTSTSQPTSSVQSSSSMLPMLLQRILVSSNTNSSSSLTTSMFPFHAYYDEVYAKSMMLMRYWHRQLDAVARLPAMELVQLRWVPLFSHVFLTHVFPTSFTYPYHLYFHRSDTSSTATNNVKKYVPLTSTQRLEFMLTFARAMLHRSIEHRDLLERLQARGSAGVLGGNVSLEELHSLQGVGSNSSSGNSSSKQANSANTTHAQLAVQKLALTLVQDIVLVSHEMYSVISTLFVPNAITANSVASSSLFDALEDTHISDTANTHAHSLLNNTMCLFHPQHSQYLGAYVSTVFMDSWLPAWLRWLYELEGDWLFTEADNQVRSLPLVVAITSNPVNIGGAFSAHNSSITSIASAVSSPNHSTTTSTSSSSKRLPGRRNVALIALKEDIFRLIVLGKRIAISCKRIPASALTTQAYEQEIQRHISHSLSVRNCPELLLDSVTLALIRDRLRHLCLSLLSPLTNTNIDSSSSNLMHDLLDTASNNVHDDKNNNRDDKKRLAVCRYLCSDLRTFRYVLQHVQPGVRHFSFTNNNSSPVTSSDTSNINNNNSNSNNVPQLNMVELQALVHDHVTASAHHSLLLSIASTNNTNTHTIDDNNDNKDNDNNKDTNKDNNDNSNNNHKSSKEQQEESFRLQAELLFGAGGQYQEHSEAYHYEQLSGSADILCIHAAVLSTDTITTASATEHLQTFVVAKLRLQIINKSPLKIPFFSLKVRLQSQLSPSEDLAFTSESSSFLASSSMLPEEISGGTTSTKHNTNTAVSGSSIVAYLRSLQSATQNKHQHQHHTHLFSTHHNGHNSRSHKKGHKNSITGNSLSVTDIGECVASFDFFPNSGTSYNDTHNTTAHSNNNNDTTTNRTSSTSSSDNNSKNESYVELTGAEYFPPGSYLERDVVCVLHQLGVVTFVVEVTYPDLVYEENAGKIFTLTGSNSNVNMNTTTNNSNSNNNNNNSNNKKCTITIPYSSTTLLSPLACLHAYASPQTTALRQFYHINQRWQMLIPHHTGTDFGMKNSAFLRRLFLSWDVFWTQYQALGGKYALSVYVDPLVIGDSTNNTHSVVETILQCLSHRWQYHHRNECLVSPEAVAVPAQPTSHTGYQDHANISGSRSPNMMGWALQTPWGSEISILFTTTTTTSSSYHTDSSQQQQEQEQCRIWIRCSDMATFRLLHYQQHWFLHDLLAMISGESVVVVSAKTVAKRLKKQSKQQQKSKKNTTTNADTSSNKQSVAQSNSEEVYRKQLEEDYYYACVYSPNNSTIVSDANAADTSNSSTTTGSSTSSSLKPISSSSTAATATATAAKLPLAPPTKAPLISLIPAKVTASTTSITTTTISDNSTSDNPAAAAAAPAGRRLSVLEKRQLAIQQQKQLEAAQQQAKDA